MASFGLHVIRHGLALASAVSPALGAKLAYRLFCTTESRKPKGRKAVEVHREGLEILSKADMARLPVSGGTVVTYAFPAEAGPGAGQNAPRVLLVHGWGSSAPYLARMAEGLSKTGVSVVVIDLPGHGRSSGRHLDIRRAVNAISATSKHYGGFDTIIAHSFGGATAIIAATGFIPGMERLHVSRLAIIGAPSRLDFIFGGFAKALGMSSKALRHMELEAEKSTGLHPSTFKGEQLLAGLDVPVLILHAEDDKEVGEENARRYQGIAPHISLEWANGLGHRRIVSDSTVIARLGQFVVEMPGNTKLTN